MFDFSLEFLKVLSGGFESKDPWRSLLTRAPSFFGSGSVYIRARHRFMRWNLEVLNVSEKKSLRIRQEFLIAVIMKDTQHNENTFRPVYLELWPMNAPCLFPASLSSRIL